MTYLPCHPSTVMFVTQRCAARDVRIRRTKRALTFRHVRRPLYTAPLTVLPGARAASQRLGRRRFSSGRFLMRSVSSTLVTVALVMLAAATAGAQTPTQAGTPAAKPVAEQQRRELRERAQKRRDLR